MKPTLMIDKEAMRYKLFVPETDRVYCDKCERICNYGEDVLVVKSYDKHLPFQKLYFCGIGCKYEHKIHIYDQVETVAATVVQHIDKKYEVIDDYPTELKLTKINLFQAANLESERVIDKTVHAGKESLLGARIGVKDYISLKKENKELNWSNLKREK